MEEEKKIQSTPAGLKLQKHFRRRGEVNLHFFKCWRTSEDKSEENCTVTRPVLCVQADQHLLGISMLQQPPAIGDEAW